MYGFSLQLWLIQLHFHWSKLSLNNRNHIFSNGTYISIHRKFIPIIRRKYYLVRSIEANFDESKSQFYQSKSNFYQSKTHFDPTTLYYYQSNSNFYHTLINRSHILPFIYIKTRYFDKNMHSNKNVGTWNKFRQIWRISVQPFV